MASREQAERLVERSKFQQQHELCLDILRLRAAAMTDQAKSAALADDIRSFAEEWPHTHDRLVTIFVDQFTDGEIKELCILYDLPVMQRFFSASIRRMIIVALMPT